MFGTYLILRRLNRIEIEILGRIVNIRDILTRKGGDRYLNQGYAT